MEYFGEEVAFQNIAESQAAGISVSPPELNMMPHPDGGAEHLHIGREPKKGIMTDDKKMIADSKALFEKIGKDRPHH